MLTVTLDGASRNGAFGPPTHLRSGENDLNSNRVPLPIARGQFFPTMQIVVRIKENSLGQQDYPGAGT